MKICHHLAGAFLTIQENSKKLMTLGCLVVLMRENKTINSDLVHFSKIDLEIIKFWYVIKKYIATNCKYFTRFKKIV